jgi:hypothetical protein
LGKRAQARVTDTFRNEQDAKAFARGKLAVGSNVNAGTLNSHLPKRTITSTQCLIGSMNQTADHELSPDALARFLGDGNACFCRFYNYEWALADAEFASVARFHLGDPGYVHPPVVPQAAPQPQNCTRLINGQLINMTCY